MTRAWQIYYNAAFGAFGALSAWMVIGLINTRAWNVHLANLFVGAGMGLLIGGALGGVEGLMVRRSLLRSLLGAAGGALVGMVSGMIGLWLGGLVFLLIQGGLIARVFGWLLFGSFLGAGLGVVGWNLKKSLYGVIGGAVGGLIGGLFYEIFTHLFLKWSEQAQMVLGAVGLSLIGVALGMMIPLSVSFISALRSERGLIVYLNGPRRGTEVEIVQRILIGSSDACEVYVPDRRVEKKQAEVTLGERGFHVQNVGSVQPFWVDQQLIVPGRQIPLQNGAMIQMGEAALRFQTYE